MRKPLWIGGLLVVLLTLAAHYRGLTGQFVEWDDTTHITQNPAIRAFTLDNLRVMFTEPIAKLYCPFTWLSFALDYRVWGRDPFGYHLTNLVLHLCNTVLVLLLILRLLADREQLAQPVALLTATIFGVHPLRVESVAWATERKDVLFAFFYLLGLLAYLTWVSKGKRSAYWCCFGLFIASTLSKSTAVTFPVILLLLDWSRHRRAAFAEKIPFFLVSAIITGATVVAQAGGEGQTVATSDVIPIWARPGLVGFCSLFYVRKFFWPSHLSAIYPSFDEMHWTPLTTAGWTLAFTAVIVMIVAMRRRAPALLPAWLFYLITLSPTIGLLPVGIHVVADYYSYLPLLGLAFVVAAGMVTLIRSLPSARWLVSLVTGSALAASVILSIRQTAVWADTGILFEHALHENPDCLPAHVNLTVWYTQHKRYDEAIAHGLRAVEIAPEGLPGRKNLAFAYINAGRYHDAVAVLRVAVDHGVDDADVWRALHESFIALGDDKNAAAAKSHWLRLTGAGD